MPEDSIYSCFRCGKKLRNGIEFWECGQCAKGGMMNQDAFDAGARAESTAIGRQNEAAQEQWEEKELDATDEEYEQTARPLYDKKGRDYYKDQKGRKVQRSEGIEVEESAVFGEGWALQDGSEIAKGYEYDTSKEGTDENPYRKKKSWWEP
tara:strand:+ start:434 stop:886 length:453 start_codon:yes stop_codon:yes gene_type:complete